MKWFNPEKGFGFVELTDGSGEAFLHISAVERAGHSALESGTTLVVRTGQGQRGAQVTEVVSVDTSTAQPEPPRAPRAGGFSSGGARSFGGVREFATPSNDPGYLAPFAAPGSTGAIALVRSPQGQVSVQALASATTFASLSDEILGMITGIRVRRGGSS